MTVIQNPSLGTATKTSKLTTAQRKERMRLFLGAERNKVKGMPGELFNAVDLNEYQLAPQDIPDEVITNISNYPKEQGISNSRIISMNCTEDGGMVYSGVVVNGNEHDPKIRATFAVSVLGDEQSALNEIQQLAEGKLTEVSERTIPIHDSLGTDLTGITIVKLEDWKM